MLIIYTNIVSIIFVARLQNNITDRPQTDGETIQTQNIYEGLELDSHRDIEFFVAKARKAVAQELRQNGYPVSKESELQQTDLPEGYENSLQDVCFAFRYRATMVIIRFERSFKGMPNFSIKPSVLPQIKIIKTNF